MTDVLGLAAWILAAESPSVPVEVTALAALVGMVWWLVRRSDQQDKTRDDELRQARKDLDDLRKLHHVEIEQVRAERDLQRSEKHSTVNRLSAALGALAMVRAAADSCTCDALGPVPGLIDQILKEQHP